jgi:hypothetical protein
MEVVSTARRERSFRVAERDPRGREGAREPTVESSRGSASSGARFRSVVRDSGRVGLAVLAIGAVAGVLLVLTEFSTVARVDLSRDMPGVSDSCEVLHDTSPKLADRCRLSGFERHGGAFLVLGLLTVLMAAGGGPGRSRPAAVALLLIGAVVLIWTLTRDLHEAGRTGVISTVYAGAEGVKGPGFYMELVAGVLAAGAGLTRLFNPNG